ncbi:lipopolysaccharide kinase InaA family protein [Azoarcus taiwanensis]|uniref:Toluene tolerance protein n=1 Tax=Azoarcus taiwanensis TaxID=666964 RepID=A0A972F7D2_9RHOO|nr:lipopolysaccharide kinase InaA family protein [Azoarcus taiwanensis]NMG03088.1 toluene tolerance protein [Azoarcus taiwanensis]
MRRLSLQDFEILKRGSRVIEKGWHGEKVLLRPNGNYLKLFRRKRLISSAWWYPYAERFANNSKTLEQRGIPCPKVIELLRVPEIQRDAVHYEALPGRTLRALNAQGLGEDSKIALKAAFNRLVQTLHDEGIYFRSLHLNNIVLTPDGDLGLIDISDIRFHRKPLSKFWRKRNLQRMENIPSERDWLDHDFLLGQH